MEQINIILDNVRNSLGNYCINECHALCCKKGYLGLHNEDEVKSITARKKTFYFKNKTLEKIENTKYRFNLEKNNGCPNLTTTFTCNIHTNPNRPRLCKDFPIFKVKDFIITASFCPAIENKILQKEFDELREMGYRII